MTILTGENEHAWVEYYEDGIGWIPFEATTPYSEIMERADTISHADTTPDDAIGDSLLDGEDTQGEDSGDEAEEDELPNEAVERVRAKLRVPILTILLLLLLLILAAIVIIQIIRRAKTLKLRRKSFEAENTAEAICSIFAYSMRLLYLSGISRKNRSLDDLVPEIEASLSHETCEGFASCLDIHREARFSGHVMCEEARAQTHNLMECALIELRERCGGLKRFKLRWIDFVY